MPSYFSVLPATLLIGMLLINSCGELLNDITFFLCAIIHTMYVMLLHEQTNRVEVATFNKLLGITMIIFFLQL